MAVAVGAVIAVLVAATAGPVTGWLTGSGRLEVADAAAQWLQVTSLSVIRRW